MLFPFYYEREFQHIAVHPRVVFFSPCLPPPSKKKKKICLSVSKRERKKKLGMRVIALFWLPRLLSTRAEPLFLFP